MLWVHTLVAAICFALHKLCIYIYIYYLDMSVLNKYIYIYIYVYIYTYIHGYSRLKDDMILDCGYLRISMHTYISKHLHTLSLLPILLTWASGIAAFALLHRAFSVCKFEKHGSVRAVFLGCIIHFSICMDPSTFWESVWDMIWGLRTFSGGMWIQRVYSPKKNIWSVYIFIVYVPVF